MLIEYKKVDIYQQDEIVLKDVDFCINKGEFTYIIGKVGSGKSSLLKSFYGELDLYKEDCEMAEILGENLLTIHRKDIPKLRRRLGLVFQDFQLLHDRSVYQNLLFVLKATGWKDRKKMDIRIDEVLQTVGLPNKKDKMPHELSGGEQQRIAIARAILNHPEIIIADEPTGNLDTETAEYIVKLLKNITLKGTSVIMSTHNISMLDKFPGIVYSCMDGEIKNVTTDYNHSIHSNNLQ